MAPDTSRDLKGTLWHRSPNTMKVGMKDAAKSAFH
jgi:hypothetical protein